MAWGRLPYGAAFVALVLAAQADTAVQVKVRQEAEFDGVTTTLAEEAYASTDAAFESVTAPKIEGARFVYWRADPAQPNFVRRDGWGRAYDKVSVVPKDHVVTLVAVYMPAGDEAEKIYWYGDASVSMSSDTDGDGYTFAQELAHGTNPHFPDQMRLGGITFGDGEELLYNPNSYQPYIVRCDPEGALFETRTQYVVPGTRVTTESYSPASCEFAYWTVDGVRQADAFGRSCDAASFTMPNRAVTVVARCMSDEQSRLAHYWYGRAQSPDSDTDGDGYTFAEEIANGTNPLFPDRMKLGGVTFGDSNEILYNPNSYSPYSISSEPDGVFAPVEGYLRPGEKLATENFAGDGAFMYWTLNGVRQADAFGRARDVIELVGTGAMTGAQNAVAHFASDDTSDEQRAIAYWYGPDNGVTLESDTDGDGYTLAQEIANGTNPHFPDEMKLGGITYGEGPLLETNLQLFDLSEKALVNGEIVNFFAAIDPAGHSLVGGIPLSGAVAVAVCDVNGDGALDVLVYSGTGLKLYRGTSGTDGFEPVDNPYPALARALAGMERAVFCPGGGKLAFCDNGGAISVFDFAGETITPTFLAGWPLWDGAEFTTLAAQRIAGAQPENPTSAALADVTGDGISELLVAEGDGRISLYSRAGDGEPFVLQHRVWGGSFAGFATGLAIAPVDWDGDGDVDLVSGTSDGRIVLLCDPNVGAPMNLRGEAGYDTVALTWSPNGQSRVSGYKAYRAAAESDEFVSIAETKLPSYRDEPPGLFGWSYYVTALSRLWTAGNSEPEVYESGASNAITVNFGSVELSLPGEMVSYDDAEVLLPVFINNSTGVAARDFALTVSYDAAKVSADGFETSALTEKVALQSSAANGVWRFTASGGTLVAGSGELFTLRFRVAKGAVGEAVFSVTEAHMLAGNGAVIGHNALPVTTRLTIVKRELPPEPPEPPHGGDGQDEPEKPDATAVVPWTNGDCDGDGKLTWEFDFDAAMNHLKTYHAHGKSLNHDNEYDNRIHASILQAVGLPPKANLRWNAEGKKLRDYFTRMCGPQPGGEK